MSFVPTPLATPILAPNAASAFKAVSYITPSGYRFAPTAVGTNMIVPGSNQQQVDSTASLAQVIARASSWIDDHCFHRADGSFCSAPTVEQMVATVKPDGSMVFITNFKPLRELIGLAIGPFSGQLENIDQNTASMIVLGEKTITLPGGFISGYPTPWFGGWPSVNGKCIGVYSYISGWPHTTLAASASAGASTITVEPPVAGATALWGAYAGTALTIKDGAQTETVVLATTPTGLTLTLQSGLQYAHVVPEAPDAIGVTALPAAVEEAAIAVTNVLLKTQGMRAQVPSGIGSASPSQRQSLARAGALADFDVACKNLKPYRTVYVH